MERKAVKDLTCGSILLIAWPRVFASSVNITVTNTCLPVPGLLLFLLANTARAAGGDCMCEYQIISRPISASSLKVNAWRLGCLLFTFEEKSQQSCTRVYKYLENFV